MDLDTGIHSRKVLHWVIGYVLIILVCGAAVNYFAAGLPSAMALAIALWCGLYAPLIVLPEFAHWQITEFGLLINWRLVVTLVLLLLVVILKGLPIVLAFNATSLMEGFARTGEEIFFRGFLIALLLRICREKRHPWIWAAVFSSLAFTLVHTHRYLLDGPSFSAAWNIFFAGMLLAFIRLWTGSVLPGALLHSGVNSDISAAYYGAAIIASFSFWAWRRGENLFSVPPHTRTARLNVTVNNETLQKAGSSPEKE